MKPGIRKLINFLFIGVTIALVCILAFGNSDLENAWEALFTLDPWWLLGAGLPICSLTRWVTTIFCASRDMGSNCPLRSIFP